ncbi:MAG TPA: hypothetical protein VK327_10725 [Candidatus Paceibacterota bacterium]|nr:hypothetical protein [Candidatus Paceibacterota bacterium]
MFDFFKNLFAGKQAENGNQFQQPAPPPAPARPAPHRPVATPSSQTAFRSRFAQPTPPPAAATSRATVHASPNHAEALHASESNGHDSSSGAIQIPVSSILVSLPMELKARVRPGDVGNATMAIPLQHVFSQLASGAVKIPFGELRQTYPQLFTTAADCDEMAVALPLAEILNRLNPALLVRREDQKQIEIPDDISSPFGNHGDGLIFAAGPRATEPAPQPRAVTPSAPQRAITPTPPPAAPPPNQANVFQQKPVPSPATQPRAFQAPVPPAPFKARPVPPAPLKPSQPVTPPPLPQRSLPGTQHLRPNTAHIPRPPTAAPATPISPIAPTTPRNPIAPRPPVAPAAPAPAPAQQPIEDAPAIPASAALRNLGKSFGMPPSNPPAAQSARPQQPLQPTHMPTAPAPEVPSLSMPLKTLAESWPDTLRGEIAKLNLGNATVGLPIALIEDAMRKGKVAFPWATIRSWIRPTPPPTVSVHDSLMLELPLRILAPLFMQRIKDDKPQQKVAIDESIPNLFFGFPQPDAEPAKEALKSTTRISAPTAAKPEETNYYAWNDSSDVPRTDETDFKRPPSIQTNFLSRRATPNEVVAQASLLDGVVGALVALPDGLMVASKVPAELNADTLAAFLPHIFGKVSQCTKELRMGDLNNLNFTVGNIPWKIFRVNAIYFAAFGRAGEGLPSAQLAALAAQLDRKKQ